MGINEIIKDRLNVLCYGIDGQQVSSVEHGVRKGRIVGRNFIKGQITIHAGSNSLTVPGRHIGEPIMPRPGPFPFDDGLEVIFENEREG